MKYSKLCAPIGGGSSKSVWLCGGCVVETQSVLKTNCVLSTIPQLRRNHQMEQQTGLEDNKAQQLLSRISSFPSLPAKQFCSRFRYESHKFCSRLLAAMIVTTSNHRGRSWCATHETSDQTPRKGYCCPVLFDDADWPCGSADMIAS